MLGEGHELRLPPQLVGIASKRLEVDDLDGAGSALERLKASMVDDGGCAEANDVAELVVVWLRRVHRPVIDD